MPAMSAVRMPEQQPSFHSRSLSSLYTRSLRDLKAKLPPPHPRVPTPEQFHRRVLQVNRPHLVQQACPPSTAIGVSHRAEVIQPSSLSIHSQVSSSMSISPFTAAKRASFGNLPPSQPIPQTYLSSRTKLPIGNGREIRQHPIPTRSMTYSDAGRIPERRNPPVDPRKTRRYCSDFGLGRDDGFKPPVPSLPSPSPPLPDDSSIASTPQAMYADTETDSDTSSVDHRLELSFPQPPPIDQSLRLRRMHSSPMFSSEETEAVKDFLRRRWREKPHAPKKCDSDALPAYGDHLKDIDDLSKDSSLEMEGESLISLDFPSIHRATERPTGICLPPTTKHDQFRYESLPMAATTPKSEVSSTISRFPSSLRRSQGGVAWKRGTDTTSKDRTQCLEGNTEGAHLSGAPSTPSCNGIVTSTIPTPIANAMTPNERSNEMSLPFPRVPTEPLNRLDLSIQKLKTYGPHQRHGDPDRLAAVPWEYQLELKPFPSPAVLNPPSLASAGRKKPTHRSHGSVPLAGLGIAYVTNASGSPRGLGTPFHHRATRSQPVVCVPTGHEPIPKSFIDITPDRETRLGTSTSRARKERMRKLLARASSGVLGWGKSLARKGMGSK